MTPVGILLNTFLLSCKSSVLTSCVCFFFFLLFMSIQLEKPGICDIHKNLVSLLYFKAELLFRAIPMVK